MKRYFFTTAVLLSSLFAMRLNAQHMAGLNFGVGPSLQNGGTPYVLTSGEYTYHFWEQLGVGGRLGHVYNKELRNFGSGNVLEDLHSLLIAAHVEYQYPMGNLMPYIGTDIGGSIFQREGFYLQPQLGTRAMITDNWLVDFSVRVPIFFSGPQNYGVLLGFGAHYRFLKKE